MDEHLLLREEQAKQARLIQMSLRDTFAAAALTGLLASGAFKTEQFATIADYAYEYADLMLAARLKPTG